MTFSPQAKEEQSSEEDIAPAPVVEERRIYGKNGAGCGLIRTVANKGEEEDLVIVCMVAVRTSYRANSSMDSNAGGKCVIVTVVGSVPSLSE